MLQLEIRPIFIQQFHTENQPTHCIFLELFVDNNVLNLRPTQNIRNVNVLQNSSNR